MTSVANGPYAKGILDGFRITLNLVLGLDAEGGVPYGGPVPDELRAWVEAALAKIEAST